MQNKMFVSLQYLRGFAAIIVVYYHIFGTWGGNQGVAIFFVISGFIMAYLINEKQRGWEHFLLSRYLRVAPLYYIATLLVLLLGIGYDPSVLRIITSFGFISLGTVLPVGWTLTYEFIFYSICTFAIAMSFFKLKKEYMIYTILILIDIALYTILSYKNYDYGHYFLVFLYGMVLYRLYYSTLFEKRSYFMAIMTLVISMIIISITEIKINFFIEYGVMAFLLVGVMLYFEKHNILNKKVDFLLLLGNASYSIYISHWIVIQVFSLQKISLFFVSIVIGVLVYFIIERPLHKYTKHLLNKEYKIKGFDNEK
ncbi:MAG: acyltransferase [Candidatus Cloacimonetes bacterium]|nr:acyltransferase [Candidatus Cloacimonadota bacterium]